MKRKNPENTEETEQTENTTNALSSLTNSALNFVTTISNWITSSPTENQDTMETRLEAKAISLFEKAQHSKNEETVIHLAAKENDIDLLDYVIKKYPDELPKKDIMGCSPLHCAASSGHKLIIDCLIKKYGLNPKAVDKFGYNALHFAAANGRTEIIKHLLETYNFKSYEETRGGLNILHIAAAGGHNETIGFLIKEYFFDGDARDKQRNTPLHYAAYHNQCTTVPYILNAFPLVEPTRKNNNYATPFDIAYTCGYMSLAHKFLYNYPVLRVTDLGSKLWKSCNEVVALAHSLAQYKEDFYLPSDIVGKIANFVHAYNLKELPELGLQRKGHNEQGALETIYNNCYSNFNKPKL